MFFVRSLAELLKGSPVVVDTVDPGYCYSDLRRSFSGVRSVIDWLMEKLFAWTSEQGGRQLVYAAVGSAEDPDKLHGAYLDLTEVTEPSDHVLGEDGKRRGDKLWVRSNALLVALSQTNCFDVCDHLPGRLDQGIV